MTQGGNDVSNMCRFLPKLTVNGQFMRDFMAEEAPCFALGLVEERKQLCGFLALRPAEVIPPEISGLGFNFGHALLGTTEFEVIQFVFHFYGFETYNMLVNPNNRLVKKVLMRMVESGDYFFFAISPNKTNKSLAKRKRPSSILKNISLFPANVHSRKSAGWSLAPASIRRPRLFSPERTPSFRALGTFLAGRMQSEFLGLVCKPKKRAKKN